MDNKKSNYRRNMTVLILVGIGSIFLSLSLGAVRISLADLISAVFSSKNESQASQIFYLVRIPRTLASLAAGAALATAGACIQSVLSNPLASPSLIGVNSGAGLGVTLASALFPLSLITFPIFAFIGAFIGVLLVLFISEKLGASRFSMILTGVAISSMFGAILDALLNVYPDALVAYSDFRIGGLANVSLGKVLPGAIVILSCLLLLFLFSPHIDILALGSEVAHSLGLPVRRIRILLLALSAALAGAAVSFAGLLGFIGLIVPHMMRRFFGYDSRHLLIASAIGGASLLTICDVAARVLFSPFELPVGVVLSLGGGPFFIFLLFKRRVGTRD